MKTRWTFAFAVVLMTATVTVLGQLPIPTRGEPPAQGPGPGRGGRGGGRGQDVQAPDPPPVVSPMATPTAEVTGPGKFYETLMELKAGDDLAHFGYVTKEYFVSGTANGQPYKTRIVIRKPSGNAKFSGFVLAESMHPSGNPWMFHFTHRYSMTEGHIGLEILTTTPAGLAEANPDRYRDLVVGNGQANEIIAQVGALLKSKQPSNPLLGLPIRKMILAGSSASAAVVVNFLPASMVQRLADMKPIYDGFMPTSNGTNLRKVDVPIIQVPTMREVFQGVGPTRVDGDAPGDQFRMYEFAGMAHIDSRDAVAYYPDPCKLPISRYPMAAYMSVAVSHMWQWLDKGIVPPHGDRFYVDYNMEKDGSLFALDEFGNVKGGIHTAYVDVPAAKFGVPNSGSEPPIKNPHPFIAARGEAAQNQLCGLANYQINFTPEQLKKLYKDKKTYVARVMQRYDELVKDGWALPVYRSVVAEDAAKVSFAGLVASATAAEWKVPRTPWGEPDLQGTWTSQAELGVPFERPAAFGTRQLVSDEEFAQREAQAKSQLQSDNAEFDIATADTSRAGQVGSATSPPPTWLERGNASRRTSLVIDPPDGRIPPTSAEGLRRQRAAGLGALDNGPFDGPENMGLYQRCITRGIPNAMFPAVYNANTRLVQGPGFVAITYEMIHETRVIPTTPRPHVKADVRQFLGDSRGHWEGDTLVVDVTNFNSAGNYRGSGAGLHLIERYKRTEDGGLRYEVTVEDDDTWARPWTAALNLQPQTSGMFEYACHEGNYAMKNMLSASRAADAR